MLSFGLLDAALAASGLSAFGPLLTKSLIAYGYFSPGGLLALLWLCAGAGRSRVGPRLPLCPTGYRIGPRLSPGAARLSFGPPGALLSAVCRLWLLRFLPLLSPPLPVPVWPETL
jgi:hypothetical protein